MATAMYPSIMQRTFLGAYAPMQPMSVNTLTPTFLGVPLFSPGIYPPPAYALPVHPANTAVADPPMAGVPTAGMVLDRLNAATGGMFHESAIYQNRGKPVGFL